MTEEERASVDTEQATVDDSETNAEETAEVFDSAEQGGENEACDGVKIPMCRSAVRSDGEGDEFILGLRN